MEKIDLIAPVEAFEAYSLREQVYNEQLSELPEDDVMRQMGFEALELARSRVDELVTPQWQTSLTPLLEVMQKD